jgi:hypothetical protein
MEGFADIEGPVRIGMLWLWIALGILGVIVLAATAWLFARTRKSVATAPRFESLRSPLDIAHDRLDNLKKTGESLEADPFTVEVSDIVRDYLESSLEIPAKEQTSEEFLLTLQSGQALPKVLEEHMPAFLNQCDWVKFAKQDLKLEQRHSLLQTAETVVDVTDAHFRRDPESSTSETAVS